VFYWSTSARQKPLQLARFAVILVNFCTTIGSLNLPVGYGVGYCTALFSEFDPKEAQRLMPKFGVTQDRR
jgi:hypothetical protein